jgi:hypothetical protein
LVDTGAGVYDVGFDPYVGDLPQAEALKRGRFAARGFDFDEDDSPI